MNYNTDGFNERSNYIHNSNDANRLKREGAGNFDNSFAQMRANEHKADIETTNNDKTILYTEARGNKDNFILRNNNMRNANVGPSSNNPVSNALNKNMFKR